MKNHILFLLIILIPVGLLTWFAITAQSNQQLASQQHYQNLAHAQLTLIDKKIISYFQQLENTLLAGKQQLELKAITNESANTESYANKIRQFLKYSPYILNIYIADNEFNALYPSINQNLSVKEQEFLSDIQVISNNRTLFNQQKEFEADKLQQKLTQSSMIRSEAVSQKLSPSRGIKQFQTQTVNQQHGWIAWYQERNIHHLFWYKDTQQRLYIIYLDRIRILSDIISLLPDKKLSVNQTYESLKDTTIRLKNSNNELVYEWGNYPANDKKSIDSMLSYPLSSWKLSWYSKQLSEDGFQQKWSLVIIALFASLLMLIMIFIVYREYNREIRQARQRVNFVSQVSHELKTPLTNIRMYAELLETKIDTSYLAEQTQEQQKSQHFLTVILNESQRLSRLIENVLSFSKVQKQTFKVTKTLGVVDDCIANVLLSFRPVFTQKKLAIQFKGNAAEPVLFDPQLIEQILNNLISNIEKYAAQGKKIDINSQQIDNIITIEVRDYGPGITKGEQKKIFQPFYRSSAKLTEGVSGTGIGLTISQQLAKLHGGSISYKNVSQGSCFVIKLEATKDNS